MQGSPSHPPVPLAQDLSSHPSLLNTRHGVFYPRGCDVFVLASMQELEAAWSTLPPDAVKADDAVALSAAQMRHLAGKSHEDASVVAEIAAAELKQVDILRDLADTHDAVFLIIRSDSLSDEARASFIESGRPMKGLSYGLLTIGERVPEDRDDLKNSPMGINERAR